MNPKSGLVTGLLFFLAVPASAEVYRNVDAYGNVTYSDEPSEGAEAVQVKPVTTITLPKPEVVQETEKLREEVQREGAAYDSVSSPIRITTSFTVAAEMSSSRCAAHLASSPATNTK